MDRVWRHSLVLMLVALLAFGLAGCGGGGEEEPAAEAPAAQEQAAAAPQMVGDPERGKQIYRQSCAACHGPDAKGIQGLGKSLYPADSEFIRGKTDDELVEFIKQGRSTDDPLNTTGVAMPPKGGNPALTDQDLYDVVAFIRTLE